LNYYDPDIYKNLEGSSMAANVNFLTGSPGKLQQVPLQTQQQMGVQNQYLQNLMQLLQGGQYAGFEPIEKQELSRFQSQTIPSIAERFTAMGGGQRSSAFQGALGSAGADLGERLAALKSQYGLQQQANLPGLLNSGLAPQFEHMYDQGQEGLLEQFGPALFGLAGQSLGQDSSSGDKWARALGTLGAGATIGGSAGGPLGAGIGAVGGGIIEALRNLFGGGKKTAQPQQQQFGNPILNQFAQGVQNKNAAKAAANQQAANQGYANAAIKQAALNIIKSRGGQ
jgi:hypothetical protein